MVSRILLADDSITIQKVVNLTFADEGIEVVAVSSGDLAERRLNEVKPDLVLADIFMPGKNGYELCEAIKQNSQFRNVPVVLLVGAFEPFDQVEARRVQADAHLTKPFESRTLVETVRRLMSTSPSTTGSVAPVQARDAEQQEVRDAHDAGLTSRPSISTSAIKLDLSAMTVDATSARPLRSTGELASPAPGVPGINEPAHEAVTQTPTNPSKWFESVEMSSNSEFVTVEPPPFAPDEADMILDFDKSETIESSNSQGAMCFDAEAGALLDAEVSGAGEGAVWLHADNLEAPALESPSNDTSWQAGNTPPLTWQSSDFSSEATTFGASEALPETAGSTLLAVDEPLGDVLLDTSTSEEPTPMSQIPTNASIDADLTQHESAEPLPLSSTQFDVVHLGEGSSSQVLFAVEENLENALVSEDAPRPSDQLSSAGVGACSSLDSHAAPQQVADNHAWPSGEAAVDSTSRPESSAMHAEAAEYPPHSSDHLDAQQPLDSEEASFTTATMWTEEHARFTPIDVEAVSTDEHEIPTDQVAETGFSFSSVAAEQSATSGETPRASATAGQMTEPAAPATDLSLAAIEEIVRRVVAEMSDSVVREVAWEVVPDCVERVIEQLTRESLSKRT